MRLYPKILKAEQHILELETQLSSAHSEHQEHRGALDGQEQEIDRLADGLFCLEEEHKDLQIQQAQVELESSTLQAELNLAYREGMALQAQLDGSESEHEAAALQLRMSEDENAERSIELGKAKEEIMQKAASLTVAEKERRRMSCNVHSTEAVLQLLTEELVSAQEDAAQCRHLHLEAVLQEASRNRDCACETDELLAQVTMCEERSNGLAHRVECCELAEEAVCNRFARQETDAKNLSADLEAATTESHALRRALTRSEHDGSSLQGHLSNSLAEHEVLRKWLNQEEDTAASVASNLSIAENDCQRLAGELGESQQEQEKQRQELGGLLSKSENQQAAWAERAETLQDEYEASTCQHGQLEVEYGASKARSSEERECLEAQCAEMQQEINRLRTRLCIIS